MKPQVLIYYSKYVYFIIPSSHVCSSVFVVSHVFYMVYNMTIDDKTNKTEFNNDVTLTLALASPSVVCDSDSDEGEGALSAKQIDLPVDPQHPPVDINSSTKFASVSCLPS